MLDAMTKLNARCFSLFLASRIQEYQLVVPDLFPSRACARSDSRI